jgi:hypothetical protein
MFNAASAAANLSAERHELRYLLPLERAQEVARALGGRLPHHRFRGSSARPLPRPHHFVTTVYFDTPDRQAFRASREAGPGAAPSKLRAREYYDLHPSLTEVATDPGQVVRHQSTVWLELKFREETRTGKRRLDVPKRAVPEVLAGAPARWPGADPEVLREVQAFCARWSQPLRADCLVHYRRLPWQEPDGALRVTLDLGIEFFDPPDNLWLRNHALTRARLGPRKGKLERAIIELKCRNAPPLWLIDLLGAVGAEPTRLSKFEEASQAVHVPD